MMLIAAFLYAQNEQKTAIAILPFRKTATSKVSNISPFQETVTREFVGRSRFQILDRGNFDKIVEELNIQTSAEFLNSRVVEQGKQAGAQYLVTGIIGDYDVSVSYTDVPSDPKNLLSPRIRRSQYQGFCNLSYQVIDVASGVAVYSENISVKSRMFDRNSEADIILNILCSLQKKVKAAVMKQFPQDMEIIKIEKTGKRGEAETVLISAGGNMFADENDKSGVCESSEGSGLLNKLTNPFKKKEKTYLLVFTKEVLNFNGKESIREIEIGKLLLDDVQGDFSVCEIKDGAKEIQEKLATGQKLYVKIK